jgi:hypothetical protein
MSAARRSREEAGGRRRRAWALAPALFLGLALGAGCAIEPLHLRADYKAPPPLPAELAARFAYAPGPIAPTLSAVEEEETFEHFEGSFDAPCPVTKEMKKVTFEMWRSKVGEGPRPCVCVVPILAGRYPECDHLGRLFSANGIHAFFVHREDDLLAFENEPADLETMMRRSVVNIRRTLDWVTARPDVDPARIGLCGISLGAIGGSIVCAVEPRFRRNVLIMGGADLAQIFWESHEIPVHAWKVDHARRWNCKTLEEFRAHFEKGFLSDPAVFAPYVDARRVLQFVSELDNKVPSPCQWKLWEALGKPEGYAIPIGHYTAIFYLAFAEEKSIHFYREGFGLPDPEAATVAQK